MKKLHKLIISTWLGPFVLTFFITLFILVMQFLWKYIDDLVGKGLEWYIIAELLFYASANLVPLALPLAILLSSIMTFGNLGEHYELVALKSAGLSLQRIMFPLIVVVLMVSVGAFYFSNNIWPVANLKFRSLLYDVRQKKPAIDLKEKVFYNGIDNFVIRIDKKDKDGQTLHDLLIYDHSDKSGNRKVIRAERGKMQFTHDERYLILTLYNGHSYEEMKEENGIKRKYPHIRSGFGEEVLRFDLSGFQLMRSDEDIFKDHYEMLNIKQLEAGVDTIKLKIAERKGHFQETMHKKFLLFRDTLSTDSVTADSVNFIERLDPEKQYLLLSSATNFARSSKTYVKALKNEFESRERTINRHIIEWHRKLTLSFACFILFFIGAPLGAIIRKGGLGMPVVASVCFFLVLHVLSITGEKLAKQGQIEPYAGMWMATVIIFPIGVFLTYKATTDSVILDINTYFNFIKKVKGILLKLIGKQTEE